MEPTFQTTSRCYSFGPFCLDAARLLLYKEGNSVALAPRFVRALLILVQNRGIDLDKSYLMDKLWPDTAVEENNLTVIISALRKVLRDDPGQHKYIVTIPGRGYRFVAEVSESATPPSDWPQEPSYPALRLTQHSADPARTAIAITRNKLAWFGGFAAFTAVVVFATFAIRGGITARANRGSLEDPIAGQIAYGLTARHDPQDSPAVEPQYTQNPKAYRLFLRGEYFLKHRSRSPADQDLRNAIVNLQAAVDEDPRFAVAYASLASAYNKVSWYLPAEQSYAKAIEAAQKALSIDNHLPEAYSSLAVAEQGYAWDFAGAEQAFRKAIQLAPQDPAPHRWYADELLAEGRNQEAEREWEKAKELDPYSSLHDTLGRIYFYSRKYKEAFGELQGKVDFDPDAFWYVAWMYSFHRAELNLGKGSPLSSRPVDPARNGEGCELAFEAAAAGNRAAVDDCVRSVEIAADTPHLSPYDAALLYAALGDMNQTFNWLDRARKAHIWNLSYVKVDPRLDSIRNDPRYGSLLVSMGLQR